MYSSLGITKVFMYQKKSRPAPVPKTNVFFFHLINERIVLV